jgi:hypothetical protein
VADEDVMMTNDDEDYVDDDDARRIRESVEEQEIPAPAS